MTDINNDYRGKLQNAISKSEDDFEQKLTYIGAGSLALSMTFIEKIIPLENSIDLIFLIVGWSFLVLTLLLNLMSHMISKYLMMKSRLEYDKNNDGMHLKLLYLKVIKRNSYIDCLNWVTVILLILGISSIVVFASTNSFNRSKKKEPENILSNKSRFVIKGNNNNVEIQVDSTKIKIIN